MQVRQLQLTENAISTTIDELRTLLEEIDDLEDVESHLELRGKVGVVQAELAGLLNAQSLLLGLGSASNRIREYLRFHVHEPVDADCLAGVAGIQDFQRRIRELREAGWDIEHVQSLGRRGGYLLRASEPDPDRGASWILARQVRGESGPPKRRILELLAKLGPATAGTEELVYVAGDPNVAMMIGELVADDSIEVLPDGHGGSLYRLTVGSRGEVRG